MTELYVKKLYDAGAFDVTLVNGTKIRPEEWVAKLIKLEDPEKSIDQQKFPELENVANIMPLGTVPYHLRIDLTTMLFRPNVIMYDPNYISKLGSMTVDDDFKLDENGIYTPTGVAAYKKEDVLKMARKFCYLGNVVDDRFNIPISMATNIIGFNLIKQAKQMPITKLQLMRDETTFMSLAIDVSSWPIEALLIDIVKMLPTDWNDMYSALMQCIFVVFTSGLVESAVPLEDPNAIELSYVGIYSNISTSNRAHTITYDPTRQKYVSKFMQILALELSRLGFVQEAAMSELMKMMTARVYELVNTSKGQSEVVIANALESIVQTLDDLRQMNEDTHALEMMLKRKMNELSLSVMRLRTVMRSKAPQVRPPLIKPKTSKYNANMMHTNFGLVVRDDEVDHVRRIINQKLTDSDNESVQESSLVTVPDIIADIKDAMLPVNGQAIIRTLDSSSSSSTTSSSMSETTVLSESKDSLMNGIVDAIFEKSKALTVDQLDAIDSQLPSYKSDSDILTLATEDNTSIM